MVSPSKQVKYQLLKIRVPRYSGKPEIMRDILPDGWRLNINATEVGHLIKEVIEF